jgi:hypothetical protein
VLLGWLDLQTNLELFDIMAKSNCMCKFDDGSECRYNDDHPLEIMTQFKIAEAYHQHEAN